MAHDVTRLVLENLRSNDLHRWIEDDLIAQKSKGSGFAARLAPMSAA
jgi:hypothetical protein